MRGAAWVALWALLVAGSASAEPVYDDPSTPTGWAWAQIRDDKIADFNAKCGKSLDPNKKEGWEEPCRQVPAQFLADILITPKLRDRIGRHGVRLVGARIDGTIDFADAEIRHQLWIIASRIEGGLDLSDSRLDKPLVIQGTTVTGSVFAERMRTESTVLCRKDTFAAAVDLIGAKIGGTFEVGGSSFAAAVNANSINVGGSFLMNRDARFDAEVNLGSARIGGNLEMETASFAKAVDADSVNVAGNLFMNGHARFGGEVNIRGAKVAGNVEMDGSAFAKRVNANLVTVEGSLFLRDHATFGGEVNLGSARIGSNLEMETASFAKGVDAASLNVASNLFMSGQARFDGEVILRGAKVAGNLEMETASFADAVDADSLSVAGLLLMNGHARFDGGVNLRGAKVTGNLEMDSSAFAKKVNANSLTVEGSLFLRDHATFGGEVNLGSARIAGNLEMLTSSFLTEADLSGASIGGDLFMSQAKFSGLLYLVGTKIGRDLFLSRATAWRINLSGATAQEVAMDGLGWWCAGGKPPTGAHAKNPATPAVPAHWPLGSPWQRVQCDGSDPARLPGLILRNAHFADFQDSPDAWPPLLDLEGFRYDRLGAFGGSGSADMRQRSPAEWADWLARDRTFSTQPYAQLASVLAAAGHRDTADAIQFIGRERERGEARYLSWLWLSFLSYVAGYGIGLYTFFVLVWVVGLTVLGADVLWYSERARRRGLPWRLGASLHRLLPVIELSKEFTDFFDNPAPPPGERPDLSRFQTAYFAGHAVAGWVLGFFLIAAMSGIIQKS